MAALMALFVLLTAVRMVMAWRYEQRYARVTDNEPVTVLQAILGGDPRLEDCLRRNAEADAGVQFLWLVDVDDAVARAVVERLSFANVRVVLGPGPKDGENPKLVKLARALALVDTPVVMVLDDDTVLDAAGFRRLAGETAAGGLVTGLPVFSAGSTYLEKLVAGFVNGNAWLTYFPVASVGAQHTINGMVYAMRTSTLRGLGGFEAAGMELTDDYAMARLFERNGLELVQSTVRAEVSLTVTGMGHYWKLMRRWMVFARMYFASQRNVAVILLAGIPAFLPLLVVAGGGWWGLGLVILKALAVRWVTGGRGGWIELAVADLLNPVFFAGSLFWPRSVTWRSRKMRVDRGEIRYEA